MSRALTDLCLKTIVEYFPTYNLAFNITKDDDMKHRFAFLQRKYSFDLLTRLTVKQESVEEYVDLLINKHLKILDTTWFRHCTWEKVTSKIAEIGSNVEQIFFSDDDVTDETPWQDMICYFPNLRSFSFPEGCTDMVVKYVANFCPNIEEIDIEMSPITSEGVKYLIKNENGESLCLKLKKLIIEHTDIEEDDVKHLLKNLFSLEVVGFTNLPLVLYSMHKNDLPFLDKAHNYNITELNLMKFRQLSYFDDIRNVCLSVCPHLKSLTYELQKNDDLNFISNLSDLEKLHIKSLIVTEKINVDGLLKSIDKKLTSLTVGNCSISISVLLENCPRIEDLSVNAVDILFDKNPKSTFNSLRSLTFDNCSVFQNIKVISLLLSSSGKCEMLAFRKCEVLSSEIKTEILKCCEMNPIKLLSFSGSEIEKEYIKNLLLNCYNLKFLDISGCFNRDDYNELLKFAEIVPNKPEIHTRNLMHNTDSDDDDDDDSDVEYGDDYDYYDSDDDSYIYDDTDCYDAEDYFYSLDDFDPEDYNFALL